ncbi:hypothetical protein DB30_05451 [Enhygromyxa salina]|uniref:Uncharacterized protein n=1 Tax=Enhygromyxa salina TaxID=215803 RepID=A0A0C2D6A9_9BACT|nr:hypothetical protein [Enhygromyxa salina]KIG15577.1 hypothetical protein DB30_05451 [Enhygromyxa salina]
MHVDRSRFLFLTASLAAAACNQAHSANPNVGSGAKAARGAKDPKAPADPAQAHLSSQTGQPTGGPSVWLEIEPGTEDKPRPSADPDCNNSAGQPKSCSLKAPGSHCESFDSTQALCRKFPEFMQPRAAEAAVDCMLAASGTQAICDWQIWQQCTGAGLQATCVDPRTRPNCESMSSFCGGSLDVFTCQQALSAVRPHNVERVASCIQEFCEVSFCVSDLWNF